MKPSKGTPYTYTEIPFFQVKHCGTVYTYDPHDRKWYSDRYPLEPWISPRTVPEEVVESVKKSCKEANIEYPIEFP